MKAPLATVGATLPGGVEIKQGASCAASTRTACSARRASSDSSDDATAARVAARPADRRSRLTTALALDDTILDINLTPNRGDCMSVLGIAREVAALTGRPLDGSGKSHAGGGARSDATVSGGADAGRGLRALCLARDPRAARRGRRRPPGCSERLRRAGLRPISAVVDVTNYVMLELGQPMHAYDLREIDGGIVVRRARTGETLQAARRSRRSRWTSRCS